MLHAGDGDPVPELVDLAAARSFFETVEDRLDPASLAAPETLVKLPSATPCSCLLRVPSLDALLFSSFAGDAAGRNQRRADRHPEAKLSGPTAWLGFRFSKDRPDFPPVDQPFGLPLSKQTEESWAWMLAFGGALVWHDRFISEILADPLTGLPGRQELQSLLERALDHARTTSLPLTLALVNPDDFGAINQTLGREEGDAILGEIGRRLRSHHRSADIVARYGGATFTVILVDTPLEDARQVMDQTRRRLADAPFGTQGVELGFSIGLAAPDPESSELDASTLIDLADRALAFARIQGGDQCAFWEDGSEAVAVDSKDPLRGVFTADPVTDYRNMSLLLKTLQSMATTKSISELTSNVLQGLQTAFEPVRLGLLKLVDGEIQVLNAISEDLPLSREQRQAVEASMKKAEPVCTEGAGPGGGDVLSCALPMISGLRVVGCIYLEREVGSEGWDSQAIDFLSILASQIGYAVDRAELLERERRHREEEHRRLQAELDGLRRSLSRSKLVYASEAIEDLLGVVQRVAPTDATLLIIGESGTGKEVLARTIHELSPRRQGPWIIVDCASIPDTLVESELFGHEKGAFTGASRKKVGRLVEADGGTVLLDEIAELPLGVQAKLLRFTQEHYVTPVGGNQQKVVDVRILASTNRDLAQEVAAGRFRDDLYHRLNVIRLDIPPLRERPKDVLVLAEHFLEQFAHLYGKTMTGFTEAAERRLLAYDWPGNVRELRNSIQRAVILNEDDRLEAAALTFDTRLSEPRTIAPGSQNNSQRASDAPWGALEHALEEVLDVAIRGDDEPLPIGDWLHQELLLTAYRASDEVGRQAAELLGMPETTFRRRIDRAETWRDLGRVNVPDAWTPVRAVLERIVDRGNPRGRDLSTLVEHRLVEMLRRRCPGDVATAAALLGVSPPTYRRRLRDHAQKSPPAQEFSDAREP